MVTQKQLQKNTSFLKDLHEAGSLRKLRTLLKSAADSCLKVLLLLVKDCVNRKIPLRLEPKERQRLGRYKEPLRQIGGRQGRLSR